MTKSVLVLGAGLVAKPLVHYLSEKGFDVIVASRTLSNVEALIKGASRAKAVQADVESPEGLNKVEELTKSVDLVISMLPYIHHVKAANFALKYGKHFLTTSYVSDAMRALDQEAKSKGLVFINECGVDPGTDHMSAMRVIHGVKAKGGKITSFTSYCGGLPAPDSNNNPLGYKFSWSPRGVLLASRNSAHFLKDGKDVLIPGEILFDNFQIFEIEGMGKFEGYPNRNSKQYIDIYGIQETQTIVRGTFRNLGWCRTIKKFVELGYLELVESQLEGKTYGQLLTQLLKVKPADSSASALKQAVSTQLGLTNSSDPLLSTMEWLGLFGDEKIPAKINTPLDALCHLMQTKMKYNPGERDLLLMQHNFTADFADKVEYITSTLIDFGIQNGDSSMSRTVSLPVAIAARLVLEGKFTLSGIQIPTIPELYHPILDELEAMGIKFVDKVVKTVPK